MVIFGSWVKNQMVRISETLVQTTNRLTSVFDSIK